MAALRILMVEDSPSDALLLTRHCQWHLPQARVEQVDRVRDAEQRLESEEFDILLLDLSLPDAKGLEAPRRLHEHAQSLPIIILSGSDSEELALGALKIGAQDHLSKNDLDGRLLARCIRHAIERKQSELALREKDGKLMRKQRLEIVGELAAGVAHEFNNLLQIIQAYTRFAQDGLDPGDQPHADLVEVRKATDRAAALTAQMLSFGRPPSMTRQVVDVNASISSLVAMLSRLVGDHIEITLSLDARNCRLEVNQTQFEQMLINICLNARDAMPHGGRLEIATSLESIQQDYCETNPEMKPGQYLRVSLRDNGYGMTEEVRQRIFDPFFTTKEVGEGTGLGLSIVYGLVQQYAGAINVYSEPGIGTVFNLYFPAEGGGGDPGGCPEQSHVGGGSETILVADDEAQVRDSTVRILQRAGYRCICCADGEQAVIQFERRMHEIDAVLLDVIMPKRTGRHVCEGIRALKSDVPVMFCSGNDKQMGLPEFAARHGITVLEKPFRSDTLLRAVRKILDGSRPKENVASAAVANAAGDG